MPFHKTSYAHCYVEILLWIANGQFSSMFDRFICPIHVRFSFPDDNLSKYQRIFTKLGTCIDRFGIANRQVTSTFERVICRTQNGGVLSFHVLFTIM